MKKVFLTLALAVTLFSCSPEEIKEVPVVDNCNCDRIAQQYTFNIVGTPSNPTTMILVKGTTVNDCTKLNKSYEYSVPSTSSNQIQKVGDCKR